MAWFWSDPDSFAEKWCFISPSESWEAAISCCRNPVEYASPPQGILYLSGAKGLIKTCKERDLFFSPFFLFTLGQNESGVAVHNERIYLVGGYSIWTNEPLACIQVSGGSSFWSLFQQFREVILQSCYWRQRYLHVERGLSSHCAASSATKPHAASQKWNVRRSPTENGDENFEKSRHLWNRTFTP